jgi:hypothetical protein
MNKVDTFTAILSIVGFFTLGYLFLELDQTYFGGRLLPGIISFIFMLLTIGAALSAWKEAKEQQNPKTPWWEYIYFFLLFIFFFGLFISCFS